MQPEQPVGWPGIARLQPHAADRDLLTIAVREGDERMQIVLQVQCLVLDQMLTESVHVDCARRPCKLPPGVVVDSALGLVKAILEQAIVVRPERARGREVVDQSLEAGISRH